MTYFCVNYPMQGENNWCSISLAQCCNRDQCCQKGYSNCSQSKYFFLHKKKKSYFLTLRGSHMLTRPSSRQSRAWRDYAMKSLATSLRQRESVLSLWACKMIRWFSLAWVIVDLKSVWFDPSKGTKWSLTRRICSRYYKN